MSPFQKRVQAAREAAENRCRIYSADYVTIMAGKACGVTIVMVPEAPESAYRRAQRASAGAHNGGLRQIPVEVMDPRVYDDCSRVPSISWRRDRRRDRAEVAGALA